MSGTNTYTGGTFVNGGVLSFTPGALPLGALTKSIIFQGGTLQWAAGNTQDVSAAIAPPSAGNSVNIDTNGNSVTFATGLAGAGGLALVGAGQLTLTASNTYTGTTTVSARTLAFAGANGSVAGNISNNSALVFANAANQTYGGTITGNGSFTKNGRTL